MNKHTSEVCDSHHDELQILHKSAEDVNYDV